MSLSPHNRELLLQDLRLAESTGGHPVLTSYQDTKGVWTIGHGRNLQTMEITAELAEEWLEEDANTALRLLVARLPWVLTLDETRLRALVELTFSMGLGNRTRGLLSFERGSLDKLRIGDYEGAAHGFAHSKWAADVKAKRAGRICHMLATGEDAE